MFSGSTLTHEEPLPDLLERLRVRNEGHKSDRKRSNEGEEPNTDPNRFRLLGRGLPQQRLDLLRALLRDDHHVRARLRALRRRLLARKRRLQIGRRQNMFIYIYTYVYIYIYIHAVFLGPPPPPHPTPNGHAQSRR